METVEQVTAELEQVNEKLLLVDADISLWEQEVEELKQSNAKLLEQHLGKERRPPSLSVQRQKILDVQNQRDELLYLKQSLQEQREQVESRLKVAQREQEIERYKELESSFLATLEETSSALSSFLSSLQSLSRQQQQQRHPLALLLRLCSEHGGKEELARYGLDLPLIAARYTEATSWMEGDFNHDLERISAETKDFVAQLEAVMAGKRAYHKIVPQRKAVKQQIIPDKSMRALGQYKILQKHEDELAKQRGFRKRRSIVRE
jgi:hypothetical protein